MRGTRPLVAFLFVALAISNVFGFFLLPVTLSAHIELGTADQAMTATATGTFFLSAALAAPIFGALLQRVEARWIVLGSSLVVAGSLIVLGSATSVWGLFAGFIVLGFGFVGAGSLSYTTYLVQRLREDAERPVGIVMTGLSLGGALLTPILSLAIAQFGLVAVAPAAALAHLLLVGVPCAIVMKPALSRAGGPEIERPLPTLNSQSDEHVVEDGAARDRRLILIPIIAFGFMASISQVSTSTQLVAIAADRVPEAIHLTLPLLAASAVIWRSLVVILLPRLPARTLLMVSASSQMVSLFGLAVASDALSFLAMVVLFGFAIGNGPAGVSLIVLEYIHPDHFSRSLSIVNAVSMGASAIGTALFGYIVMATAGFVVPIFLAGVASALGFAAILFARR